MPARYLALSETQWQEKLSWFRGRLTPCMLCPRECGVDRLNKLGICRAPFGPRISSANLHYGEEPPITGINGSGAIFLTHCNLRCVFCQNYPISQLGNGQDLSLDELAGKFLELQKRGAHNINFVSPMHYTAQIVEALHLARGLGLHLPIVWNSNAYESLEVIEHLEGLVDIYLPDLKYSRDEDAKRLSAAPGYWAIATRAIREMQRQVGPLTLDDEGLGLGGIIVRHLVLPNDAAGTYEVLKFLATELPQKPAISLMAQYFPAHKAPEMEELNRAITPEEYRRALDWLEEFDFEDGYTQEDDFRFA